MLATAVRALRAGDSPHSPAGRGAGAAPLGGTGAGRDGGGDGGPGGVPLRRTTPYETLSALRAAAAEGAPLWIGYVNAEGRSTLRMIEPVHVEGGYVSAYDHLRDEVRTFTVSRISGVASADVLTPGPASS